jgi:hypothetical protein
MSCCLNHRLKVFEAPSFEGELANWVPYVEAPSFEGELANWVPYVHHFVDVTRFVFLEPEFLGYFQ